MLIKKLKAIAQVVGIIGLILAAIQGVLTLLEGKAAWAAPTLQWGDSTIPLVVNYQGYLRDPEGNLLSGSYDITFRIYDDVVATTPLYAETQTGITVRNGYFSVLLGNNNPPGHTLPSDMFNSPDRFIGITVAPYAEMIPRQRFASVAYAFEAQQAANSDLLDNRDSSSFADKQYEYSLRARDGSPTNAVYVDNRGQVGIGTTNPEAKLTVDVGTTSWNGIHMKTDASTSDLILRFEYDDVANKSHFVFDDGSDSHTFKVESKNALAFSTNGANERMRITKGGDILVGGQKPIYFARFGSGIMDDRPNWDTGIKTSDYNCVIAGWAAVDGDVREGNGGDYIVETFPQDGTWRIKAKFYTEGDHEQWWVTLMCVDTQLSYIVNPEAWGP
jgi:hypothetical protein